MAPKKREKEPLVNVRPTQTTAVTPAQLALAVNQATAPLAKPESKILGPAAAADLAKEQPTTVSPMKASASAAVQAGKKVAKAPKPDSQAPKYESPLKKLKKAMSQHPIQLIDTIEGLRNFISSNDVADPEVRSSVRIQARLLWTTAETVKGLHFLRLFLGEAQAPEPLEEQQQQAQCRDPFSANQYLTTTSLYEVDASNPRVPTPGDVISFTPFKLRLYRNCCQADTKLQSIVTVKPPPPPLQI